VLHRRLASLLVAVSVAGLVATGCAEQSAAIRVDDDTVSRRHFEDQLDFVYDNEEFRNMLFGQVTQDQLRAEDDPPGSFRQQYVGALAGVNVQFLVVARALADEGIEVPASARDEIISMFDEQLPGGSDEVPTAIRDRYVDGLAAINTLTGELDEEASNEAFQRALDGVTVDVNPRYGTWDRDQVSVVAPAGPATE
jgi:hypothetical protein